MAENRDDMREKFRAIHKRLDDIERIVGRTNSTAKDIQDTLNHQVVGGMCLALIVGAIYWAWG